MSRVLNYVQNLVYHRNVNLWRAALSGGGDSTPGGATDVLTDDDDTVGLLDDDGVTYLTDD